MLIEFKFSNFRSFYDEQVFSMVASSEKDMPENKFHVEEFSKDILRSAVLYGANASGKSNFVKALGFVQGFIENSAETKMGSEIPITPFAFCQDRKVEPAKFEITFIHKKVRYQYGFSVTTNQVIDEWLIAYPKGLPQTWYERTFDSDSSKHEWYFGPNFKGEKMRLVNLTRPNVLFLSLAVKFNHELLKDVYDWFDYYLRVISADKLIPYFRDYTARKILEDENLKKGIASLLKQFDTGVEDISVQKKTLSNADFPEEIPEEVRNFFKGSEQYEIKLSHFGNQKNQIIPLPFEEESMGTQKLFSIFYPWLDALFNGYTLIMDEIDTSLHPLLVQKLINLFHDDWNTNSGQLIFNTHDTTLLSSSLFRRDQIWFVEKDQESRSHLYPLLEYKPRKDESLEKWYLAGRYGGIPFLNNQLEGFSLNGEAAKTNKK